MGRGTPNHDPSATGCFSGLTFAAGRADLCRAVLEGVAFGLRDICEDFDQLGLEIARVNITGGGAQSSTWRQIVADVLNRPVTLFNSDSCLGAAIHAAVGLGLYSDIEQAVQSMSHPGCSTEPNESAVDLYRNYYVSYCQLRDQLFSLGPERSIGNIRDQTQSQTGLRKR